METHMSMRRALVVVALGLALPYALATGAARAQGPSPLTLIPLSAAFNNPIGIDYHAPSDSLVMSVNYSNGQPYNFELIDRDGARTPFSDVAGLTNEVKIGTVREGPCEGGFTPGELFVGTGEAGVIARVSSDGTRVDNPWVTLPGETGLMRGALFQDRYCVVGGDLVVVTTAGNVWRVSSSGVPKGVAVVGFGIHLEGVTTVPNDPRYGPWAGRILTGAETIRRTYAISPEGDVDEYVLPIAPEDFDIVEPGEHFYGVDFGSKRLVAAEADQWRDKVGGVVIADESGPLWYARWDAAAAAFEVTLIATVSQWEHVTFAPPPILEVPRGSPTPTASATPQPSATATATPPPTATPTPTATPRRFKRYLPLSLRESPKDGRRPVTAVLILDLSTSMRRVDGSGRAKLDAALAAARDFVGRLDSERGDRVAIVGFNDRAWTAAALGDPRAAERAIAALPAEVAEGTRLDLALAEGRRALGAADVGESASTSGNAGAVILLTDGLPNRVPFGPGSTVPECANQECTVLREAQRYPPGVRRVTIGLGQRDDVLHRLLGDVASAPLDFHFAPTGAELAGVYARILRRLACDGPAFWGARCG